MLTIKTLLPQQITPVKIYGSMLCSSTHKQQESVPVREIPIPCVFSFNMLERNFLNIKEKSLGIVIELNPKV